MKRTNTYLTMALLALSGHACAAAIHYPHVSAFDGLIDVSAAPADAFAPYPSRLQDLPWPDFTAARVGEALPAEAAAAGSSESLLLNTAKVPEPETYALLMAGLGVSAALSRRKRWRL